MAYSKPMAEKVVEVQDLHFGYGELPIFSGLSLDIRRGQVVAILGGSGCGKSTLLKLIGGQLLPQQGSVKGEGRTVHALQPDELYALRLEMGMMFQNSGLFSDLSVVENIAFPLRENFDLPEQLLRRIVLMKRSEEHTSELQSRLHLVCRLLLEKKNKTAPTGSYCI